MYEDIRKSIRNKTLNPIYFLTGEENYQIDKLVELAEELIIPEEQKDFNLQVFYGNDTTIKQIIEACRQYPFIGNHKLVILKEAQYIKDWDNIINYIQSVSNYCTLVIAYKHKKPDGRVNWVKSLKSKAIYFESKSLSDYQLPNFIKNLANELSLKLEDQAIQMLAEHVGNNLSHIENELEKIKLVIDPKEKLSVDKISKFIGVSRDFNIFELNKSLSNKDFKRSIMIMQNIAENLKSNPLVLLIGNLHSHFVKIWLTKHYFQKNDVELQTLLRLPFAGFIKEYREASKLYSMSELHNIFNYLKEYDLRSKGVRSENTSNEEVFRELILKICLN